MSGALQESGEKVKNNTYCLNCGSKLKGSYCHKCGQQATDSNLTVKGFIMEYLYNAFLWDPKFLKTFWLLIRRPGTLTNYFLSGKYTSQVHPVKLNMFMLFVFVTLFVFFSGKETVNNSVTFITNDERVSSLLQMQMIAEDDNYSNKIETSPRDTVHLLAPLLMAKEYPDIITRISTIEDTNGESLDKWIAIIPSLLIEDKIVLRDDDGYYYFKTEVKELEWVENIWTQMVEFTTRYFPLMVLFTAPFLAFSIRLVQRKKKRSSITHFIFSLHYTAFLELFIIFIYLLNLIFSPSIKVLQLILLIGSCCYLAIAFRRVYGTKSWFKVAIKSLYANLVYFMIILIVFICILLSAIITVAVNSLDY